MDKITRDCIRCYKVNRWKMGILSFSCFHQMTTSSLICWKKRKFENWASSLSLWFQWDLSLYALTENTKWTLGPCSLDFICSNGSFQRQSFEEETICHCIRLYAWTKCCVKFSWRNFWWVFKISAWFNY